MAQGVLADLPGPRSRRRLGSVIAPTRIFQHGDSVPGALIYATVCSVIIIVALGLGFLFIRWVCRWRNFKRFLLALAGVVILTALFLPGEFSEEIETLEKALPRALARAVSIVVALVLVLLFIRWLRRPRNLRRFAVSAAGLAVLVTLFYAAENWRGKRAWENFKREWEAKGEKFDLASLVPPPVPDDQNFALTPIVASCYSHALDRYGRPIKPPHTNIVNRLEWSVYRKSYYGDAALQFGSWPLARPTNLKVWQDYYRTRKLSSPREETPAEMREAFAKRYGIPPSAFDKAQKAENQTGPKPDTNAVGYEFPVPPQPQSAAADVLLALSRYDTAIEELRQASRLPYSRFPVNYDTENPGDILLPHLATLRSCLRVLQLRAVAELQLDQPEPALADVKLMLRLIDSVRNEPLLVSHLVRIGGWQIALQPVWEGLVAHRWSDAQLAALDKEFQKLDFLADFQLALRGERAMALGRLESWRKHREREMSLAFLCSLFPRLFEFHALNDLVDTLGDVLPLGVIDRIARHFPPRGWYDQNQRTIGEMFQQWLLQACDPEKRVISPPRARAFGPWEPPFRLKPSNAMAYLLVPAFGGSTREFAFAQAAVDLARVACALERYRLAHGEYPETLGPLVPQFIARLPHDVITGQPLQYRRTEDGRFILYSVGWNETDDGGEAALTTLGGMDWSKGDWVWSWPSR